MGRVCRLLDVVPEGCSGHGPIHLLVASALENLKGLTPRLYADNLKCSSYNSDVLLASSQYTVAYVKALGQEASLGPQHFKGCPRSA